MKIAFIVSAFPRLSETFILDQITGLIDRGHDIDIFAAIPSDEPVVHTSVKEYNLLNKTFYTRKSDIMPQNRLIRFAEAMRLIFLYRKKKLISLLKSLNVFKYGKNAVSLILLFTAIPFLDRGPYDIIHCHFGPNGNLGVMLKEIDVIKGKIIATFHGYDAYVHPKLNGEKKYLNLFGKADLITANSTFTKNYIRGLGCNDDKIIKLPVGLNISKFFFRERKLEPGEDIRIFTVARLVEKKGLQYSIEAVAKVLKKYPAIQYKIVGCGHFRDQLVELIRKLNVEDRIKLLGWKDQDEIRKLYSEAHIFILSSITASDGDREGQGLVLQEAQSMGIPVIATLHNGFPESIMDGRSGYLVPEKDADALAERLEYLIKNPEIWPAMGYTGRKFVEENFDINKLNDRLLDIYNYVINS